MQQGIAELLPNSCAKTRWQQETDERKWKKKKKREKSSTVFTFAPSFFFHLILLPATITTSAKQSEVEERVREGCSRDTVYRFAPHPSRSSKGMENIKYFLFNLQRQLHCTPVSHLLKGRGTVDTCGQQAQRCRVHALWKRTHVPIRTSSTSSRPFSPFLEG